MNMTTFEQALIIANEEGWRPTEEALDPIYSLFDHLANGGTTNDWNYPNMTGYGPEIILAISYASLLDTFVMHEQA